MKILTDPLSIFLLVGLAIYGLFTAVAPDEKPEIVLGADARAALVGEFELLTGRTAGAADIARLEHEFIVEEVMFREALAKGLHLTSPEVRASLVESMRYRVTGVLPEPAPEELVNFYAEHLDLYRAEPTITFSHVFFETEVPAGTEAAIRDGRIPPGDTFPHGREFPAYGVSMLRGLFGQRFLERLESLPLDEWSAPIESAYGTHFVFVAARDESDRLPFRAVRNQVEGDYRQALINAAIDRELDALETKYAIRFER